VVRAAPSSASGDGPVILFKYLCFGGASVVFSFRGNKQFNLENVEGMLLSLKKVTYRSFRATPEKVIDRFRSGERSFDGRA
jgi:hypothetical protein